MEIALGAAGLTTSTARFDQNLLQRFREPLYSNPFFESGYQNPWRLPYYAHMERLQLSVAEARPERTIQIAARMLGNGSVRSLSSSPIQAAKDFAAKPGAFKVILQEMKKEGLVPGEIPPIGSIPSSVQTAAALILRTALDVARYRRAAFTSAGDIQVVYDRLLRSGFELERPEDSRFLLDLLGKVDLKFLFAGAQDLNMASMEAETLARLEPGTADYTFQMDTVWGQIKLTGAKNDIHSGAPTLLLIDTGGNDLYVGCPSTNSAKNWASVLIDTHGDDRYLSDSRLKSTPIKAFDQKKEQGTLGPGAALLGYTVLIDSEGNDLYRTHLPGLGSATLGCATLFDRAGNDIYDSYLCSIGYGVFGIGLLEDMRGDDTYLSFTRSQGHGGVHGAGVLIDRTGNDRYIADNELLEFPSTQSSEHNFSMSQGVGYGRRADYLDGHSLSGGIGILLDEKGNDEYSCGVFGQGVGYWEGTGLLWDLEGDDKYTAGYYAQGAAAHFGIGLLDDHSGNDTYTVQLQFGLGTGHDFSIGFFIDREGDDIYCTNGMALGVGNGNGIGVFMDWKGQDSYAAKSTSLGKSTETPYGTLREKAMSLGVFMDLFGKDSYPAGFIWATDARKVANWTDKRATAHESQVGIFWDR